MKTIFSKKLTALLLILVILVSLTACNFNPARNPIETPKEDILAKIEATLLNDTKEYNYVDEYLLYWGISGFDSKKFIFYEELFMYYYNFEDGLPAPLTHAADTAKLFIEYYYDSIDLKDMTAVTDALLNCYVYSVGDPYSFYRNAEEFEAYENDMSGTFGGIGVQIEYNHNEQTLMISQVFKGGPAEEGGMKVGDYIVAVDGKSLDELGGYNNAVYYVRGEIGTSVTVTVDRNGTLIDITMVRALVVDNSVEYRLTDEGYGYVAITSFKENTAEQFRAAIEALEDLGAVGYIFDLRTNPGGLVNSVSNVLSYILPKDKMVISYELKNGQKYAYVTGEDIMPEDEANESNDHVIDLPMVILCNEYTASSGEIFVACLRDYKTQGLIDDLVIVGKNTYGKGILQHTIPYTKQIGNNHYLVDNSYATLTTAYYIPPSGINYHGIGIAPDITVNITGTTDTQLAEAINQLNLMLKSK